MEPLQGALLTNLYQPTMVQAYLESGQTDTAVFDFFVRKLPPQRGFLLERTGRFNARLRADGADAGLMAARASYIAGFAGTATLLAQKVFGIPTYGTMAHSFIQSFDDEALAFEAFARARPQNLTLLIDTYDTEAAARKVVALAPPLRELGIAVRAVRIDSGDLAALAKGVRVILDEGGLEDTGIFASGGIEEETLVGAADWRMGLPEVRA